MGSLDRIFRRRASSQQTIEAQVQNIIRRQSLAFNGVWYDPSDLSTLFQDAAGTIPVTAVEQSVGLLLDKSGRGNHASQSTTGYKPVLSARVNRLTKSEDFSDAAWTKYGGASVTPDATTAPNGTLTADLLLSTGAQEIYASGGSKPAEAQRVKFTIRFKRYNFDIAQVVFSDFVSGGVTANFDLSSGAASIYTYSAWQSPVASMTSIGDGWWLCTLEATTKATTGMFVSIKTHNGTAGAGVYLWGADWRYADVAGCPAYQRVNTATDYDTVGFPKYLKFDGSDDFLSTANIDFSTTDKVAVAAGVRKLSDVATGVVAQFSGDWQVDNGSWGLYAPGAAGSPRLDFLSKGTSPAVATDGATAAPVSAVVAGVTAISADVCTIRKNGVQRAATVVDQGAGNFRNLPLYVGKNLLGGSAFSGHLYGLVVLGGVSDLGKLTKVERLLAKKTGVVV